VGEKKDIGSVGQGGKGGGGTKRKIAIIGATKGVRK
jgi:hypothetical protein